MKFLDVKTDYAFKKVFGSLENKDILIDFLNSVIDFEKDNNIVDLMIVDPYNIPMLKGMKDTYVDVKAELQDKSKIIIEMQVLNHEGFEKRILYNAAKNYSIQLHKKEDYQLLNPVIALTIVDFIMFEETDKIITNFKMVEKDDFINYNDDIELIFIELPKFNKTLDNLQGIQEQWLYFIKNAGSLEYIPKKLNKPIMKALEVVNEANFTEEELELQYKRKEFISIQRLAVLKAKNDGLKQGIQEGIEKGKEDIAISLFDVLDIDIISKKTGLSIERLNQLKEAHSKQS
jgi:predicted transposase/invertase (TIGR01784 family)